MQVLHPCSSDEGSMAKLILFDVWLRRRMAERNVDSATLAKAIGVHPSTIGRWLDDGRIPDLRQAVRLANFFQVTVDVIAKLTHPSDYFDLHSDKGKQEEEIFLLSELEDARDFLEALRRASPKTRVAWLTLFRGDRREEERDQ